jgi:hypothetical protein
LVPGLEPLDSTPQAALASVSRRAPTQRAGAAVVLAAAGDAGMNGRGDSTSFATSGLTDLRKPA